MKYFELTKIIISKMKIYLYEHFLEVYRGTYSFWGRQK